MRQIRISPRQIGRQAHALWSAKLHTFFFFMRFVFVSVKSRINSLQFFAAMRDSLRTSEQKKSPSKDSSIDNFIQDLWKQNSRNFFDWSIWYNPPHKKSIISIFSLYVCVCFFYYFVLYVADIAILISKKSFYLLQ